MSRRFSEAVTDWPPCAAMMRRASLAVSSPREPRRNGLGSGGMRVRLVLFEDTDIAFMIRLEVRDSQVEHSTIRHSGKPMLGEQTFLLPENIAMRKAVGGVVAGDVHKSIRRFHHQHDGERDDLAVLLDKRNVQQQSGPEPDLTRFQRHRDASMLSQIPRPRSSPQIHPFLGSPSLSNGQDAHATMNLPFWRYDAAWHLNSPAKKNCVEDWGVLPQPRFQRHLDPLPRKLSNRSLAARRT